MRLELWFELDKLGLKTTVEQPEPTRSDCHAWGAHPLFHYFATLLGIRPAAPGFHAVEVQPRLGPLASARGRLVHPRGEIIVDCRSEADGLQGEIKVPAGLTVRLAGGDNACFHVEELLV